MGGQGEYLEELGGGEEYDQDIFKFKSCFKLKKKMEEIVFLMDNHTN